MIFCKQTKYLYLYIFSSIILYLFTKQFSIIVKRIAEIFKLSNKVYCFNYINK